MPRLSKSRIMSSLQCLKRVHLEINRKELAHFSRATEAAFALGHEDVLLPISENGNDSWRIVEVKASTRLKPEYIHDCAVQAWVHLGAGHPLDMDYAQLEGIQEGMAASAAYLKAIDPSTSNERKEEIREELLKYCKHDTEAMVRLVEFFANQPESSQ